MWKIYLFQTTTGQIGPQVEVEAATWSVSLNGNESAKIDLKKSSLPAVDFRYWLAPWWAGVLFMWNDVPVFAGPIIGRPTENFRTVSIDCGGYRNILARRLLVEEMDDWTNISKTQVKYRGMALGTIAKQIVQLALRKSGGSLPVSYPVADMPGPDDEDHMRTFNGFDVANLNVDDVLTKLSNVTAGPDVMFRPRMLEPSRITMDFWTGIEGNHRIPQAFTPIWDTTAEASSVSDMQMIVTGSYKTNRVYASGAGSDQGTLIRVASNLDSVVEGFPLLETTYPSGDSTDPSVVQAHANGALNANDHELQEIQMTVRADGAFPLGTFFPGDLVQIVIAGWVSLPDGVHNARLLNFNGNMTNDVKLSLQIED